MLFMIKRKSKLLILFFIVFSLMFNRVVRMSSFFQNTFGFDELSYAATQSELAKIINVEKDPLGPNGGNWQRVTFNVPNRTSPIDGGVFRFDSVAELRETAKKMLLEHGYRACTWEKAHLENGESRGLHSLHPGGMFQAASQFNCLEFVAPNVTPERGITSYASDRTQGPACAIACAAGTAVRNYFAPVDEKTLTCGNLTLPEPNFKLDQGASGIAELQKFGQVAQRQLNGLADVEKIFHQRNPDVEALWRVKNGYIELTNTGAGALPVFGKSFSEQPDFFRQLVSAVRVGSHFDCEVTDLRANGKQPEVASQVFASACSIGYSRYPDTAWEPIAKIALYGAYEATFYAHIINELRWEKRGKSQSDRKSCLFLTKLGGGVFQNPSGWISEAMIWAEKRTRELFDEVSAGGSQQQQQAQQEQEMSSEQSQDAAAPSSSPISKSSNGKAFKFSALVTHFREAEPGYENFIKYSPAGTGSQQQ